MLLIFLAGACRAAYVTGIRSSHVTVKELDSLQLEDCTKLMIVAHPDDETIWGGAHLADKGYFVVCLTIDIIRPGEMNFEYHKGVWKQGTDLALS